MKEEENAEKVLLELFILKGRKGGEREKRRKEKKKTRKGCWREKRICISKKGKGKCGMRQIRNQQISRRGEG